MVVRRPALALMLIASSLVLQAQRGATPSPAPTEAAQLAQGLNLLAQGDAARAEAIATSLLAQFPASTAVVAFAVDVAAARANAAGALEIYERWLGARRLDEAYVLRRVARAMLRETARGDASPAVKVQALMALAADDDADARAELDRMAADATANTVALAPTGNDRVVRALIVEMNAMPGSKARQIDALGGSHNALAVRPLTTLLSDPMDVNRSHAADALGRLGATDAIPALKPLLADPAFPVQLKAAGALYRMNDLSGITLLRQLESSTEAGYRLAAAEAMSGTPDAAWQALVRALAQDAADATIRAAAARLIAPYDQALAKVTLERLQSDENIAVRELAANTYIETIAGDFATLRRFLRHSDAMTRVRAAGRILELTR
jgi:HEAT repeat protein